MFRRMLQAFTAKDGAKLIAAAAAIAWGLQVLTAAVEDRQAQADELDAMLAAKRDELAQLDALARARRADLIDDMEPEIERRLCRKCGAYLPVDELPNHHERDHGEHRCLNCGAWVPVHELPNHNAAEHANFVAEHDGGQA